MTRVAEVVVAIVYTSPSLKQGCKVSRIVVTGTVAVALSVEMVTFILALMASVAVVLP